MRCGKKEKLRLFFFFANLKKINIYGYIGVVLVENKDLKDLCLQEVNNQVVGPMYIFFLLTPRILESDDLAPKSSEIPLPEPELSNLKDILELLSNANTMHEKDKISAYILTEVNEVRGGGDMNKM